MERRDFLTFAGNAVAATAAGGALALAMVPQTYAAAAEADDPASRIQLIKGAIADRLFADHLPSYPKVYPLPPTYWDVRKEGGYFAVGAHVRPYRRNEFVRWYVLVPANTYYAKWFAGLGVPVNSDSPYI